MEDKTSKVQASGNSAKKGHNSDSARGSNPSKTQNANSKGFEAFKENVPKLSNRRPATRKLGF